MRDKYMYYCSVFRRTAALPEVEQFALRLEDSHWNYGECDNDVVIVYSAGDNVVSYLSWYFNVCHTIWWDTSAGISIVCQTMYSEFSQLTSQFYLNFCWSGWWVIWQLIFWFYSVSQYLSVNVFYYLSWHLNVVTLSFHSVLNYLSCLIFHSSMSYL